MVNYTQMNKQLFVEAQLPYVPQCRDSFHPLKKGPVQTQYTELLHLLDGLNFPPYFARTKTSLLFCNLQKHLE